MRNQAGLGGIPSPAYRFVLPAENRGGLVPMTKRIIFAFVFLLALVGRGARAQSLGFRYFAETGHNVKGDFLEFYDAVLNPMIVYGYPITDEMISKDGLTVQYFQRARFEYHPEAPVGQRVRTTDVGRTAYTPMSQLYIDNPFSCRTYAETGFAVCFAFLEFFDAHGGMARFGYPISPFEYHDGLVVQYFEKARMEWRPWMSESQRVGLADLGRAYFEWAGEDPSFLLAVGPLDNSIVNVVQVRVSAYVWKAVTLATDSQLAFIVVQNQNLQPIAGAICSVFVRWPDGATASISVVSNSNGIGLASLAFVNQPYGGEVFLDVSCAYSGLVGETSTSFRIWY
jgi:hypothetical protein